jgi:hypothetical protein
MKNDKENTKNVTIETNNDAVLYSVSGSDYRVEEYDGTFQIQRKEVIKKTIGSLWWKKTTEETKWKYVDKWGECLFCITGYIYYDNYHQKIKPFTDLKSAFDQIDIMIAGVKYHYR